MDECSTVFRQALPRVLKSPNISFALFSLDFLRELYMQWVVTLIVYDVSHVKLVHWEPRAMQTSFLAQKGNHC